MPQILTASELVTYDPANIDTYPSVCQSPEEVKIRFGFSGGETLLFTQHGSYLGQLIKQLEGAIPEPRKRHVRVKQQSYLEFLKLVDERELDLQSLADAFDVHVSTARRHLDGLVFQGKLEKDVHTPWQTSIYRLPRVTKT